LDYKIKFSAISEALTLLNINSEARKEYEERKRKQIVFRNFNRNKELEKENKKKISKTLKLAEKTEKMVIWATLKKFTRMKTRNTKSF
jgi:hypothetical protein